MEVRRRRGEDGRACRWKRKGSRSGRGVVGGYWWGEKDFPLEWELFIPAAGAPLYGVEEARGCPWSNEATRKEGKEGVGWTSKGSGSEGGGEGVGGNR